MSLPRSTLPQEKMPTRITISYGQAILILIDYYQQQKTPDLGKLQRLKYFYGSGIKDYSESKDCEKTQALRKELDDLIQEGRNLGLFAKYEISDNAKVIDEDTTRRTFETALAVATIPYALKDLQLKDLKAQFDTLYNELDQWKEEVDDCLKLINELSPLRGDAYNKRLNEIFQQLSKEFIDAICTINSPERFTVFSPEEREKFKYIMLNALVGYWVFQDKVDSNKYIPFEHIYFGEERGRNRKEDTDSWEHPNHKVAYKLRMATRQVGLYRSYHSASLETCDQRTNRYKRHTIKVKINNHIQEKIIWRSVHPNLEPLPQAYRGPVIQVIYPSAPHLVGSDSKETIVSVIDPSLAGIYRGPFLRVADRFSPNMNYSGPKENFALLVHPYSAGISGSTVVHMGVLKYLDEQGKLLFNNTKTLSAYLKCFMAGLLYSGGAHTFTEMTNVLAINDIRVAFEKLSKPLARTEQSPGDTKDANMNTNVRELPFHIEKFSDINLDTLIRIGNEEAFDKALVEAIKDNKKWLQKSELHQQLLCQPRLFSQAESGMVLKSLEFYNKIMNKNPKIKKLLEEYIANRIADIERYCQRDERVQMDSYKNIFALRQHNRPKSEPVNFSVIEHEQSKLSRRTRESIKMRFLASIADVDFSNAFLRQEQNYQNLVKFLEKEPLVVLPLLILEKNLKNFNTGRGASPNKCVIQ